MTEQEMLAELPEFSGCTAWCCGFANRKPDGEVIRQLWNFHLDHIDPVSAGGINEIVNRAPMCAHHNIRKSNRLVTLRGYRNRIPAAGEMQMHRLIRWTWERRNLMRCRFMPATQGGTTMNASIAIPGKRIDEFCRRHHIRRLALYGAALRGDFGPDDCVETLVEFEPEHIPGLAFFAMQRELGQILGRPVELSTPNWISPEFRRQALVEAEDIYANGRPYASL